MAKGKASEQKKKPVNSIKVYRPKKGDESGKDSLYAVIDRVISEYFLPLRDLDYLIILKKNWRADGHGNLKQVQAKLRSEEQRITIPYQRDQGRDAIFLMNYDTFAVDPERGMVEFWAYQLAASIEVVKRGGKVVMDEQNRVVYRSVKPDLNIHSGAFAAFGVGGLTSLMRLALEAKTKPAAYYEFTQKMLFESADQVEVPESMNENEALAAQQERIEKGELEEVA